MRFTSGWVLLLLLSLSACQPTAVSQPALLLLKSDPLEVWIAPGNIPVEYPLQLTLALQQPVQQIQAEITGLSMYMGRIPLRFTRLDTLQSDWTEQWQAEFLLGACSDPQMKWQLKLTVLYQSGEQVELIQTFSSSWK